MRLRARYRADAGLARLFGIRLPSPEKKAGRNIPIFSGLVDARKMGCQKIPDLRAILIYKKRTAGPQHAGRRRSDGSPYAGR